MCFSIIFLVFFDASFYYLVWFLLCSAQTVLNKRFHHNNSTFGSAGGIIEIPVGISVKTRLRLKNQTLLLNYDAGKGNVSHIFDRKHVYDGRDLSTSSLHLFFFLESTVDLQL